jgi:hypothetical protein
MLSSRVFNRNRRYFAVKRLKILGLAVIVACACSAAIVASASATTIKVLPESTIKLKGTGGSGTLEKANGKIVECSGTAAESEIPAGKILGTFSTTFTGCKGLSGLVTCTGLGLASGEIKVSGEYHLVYDKLTTLGLGILFLVTEAHFACSIVLVHTRGQVLCLILQINTSTTHNELHCELVKTGKPGETVYWNSETGAETKLSEKALEASENGGAFEGSGESILVLLESTTAAEMMA